MNTAKVSNSDLITVVLDTNIVVSSVVFGGKPRDIFSLIIEEKIIAYFSSFVLFEVTDVLRNKFDFDENKLELIEKIIKKKFVKVSPKNIPLFSKDLSDNKILAIAQEAKADYLITGDKKHLLPLKKIKKTKIVSAEEFFKEFNH